MHRRKRNKLVSLKNSNGDWVDNPSQVRHIIDKHFIDLFTSTRQQDWGVILDCITLKVTDERNETLTSSVSVKEIMTAAMQMRGLKAPGPDGFQGIFYHSYWDIIVEDVNELIGDMMNGTQNPNWINATHVVLISKV